MSGRNKVDGVNEFGVKRIGRKPAINAARRVPFVFLVICLLIAKTISVKDATNIFGNTFATIVMGKNTSKKDEM